MAKRQVEWARKARHQLVLALGANCAYCGNTNELELDCIVPQGHRHHAIGFTARVSFYRGQLKVSNLQLLCEKCHNEKSSKELPI